MRYKRVVLVLFDIDGTILTSRGMGRKAVQEALSDVCQIEVVSKGISFSGRTDPEIMRTMLSAAGLSEDRVESLFSECLEAYTRVLMQMLKPEHVRVLPGVRDLIHLLRNRDDIALGLVTGNLRDTAYLKLQAAGLSSLFSFGAFGSDSEDRYKLPELAARRASAMTGVSFTARRTVIIGDTPHDIGCGKAFGAWTVGVCTGPHDRSELYDCEPDLLLDDLSHSDPLLDLLAGIQEK